MFGVGGGACVFLGLGIKTVLKLLGHAVGFTFNTFCGGGRCASMWLLILRVWGGWLCGGWVVCELYSGCEHL